MSSSAYRYDGSVNTPLGAAVAGASVAVLGDPSDFSAQPGSPLESVFAAPASNSAAISAASFSNGQITFTFVSVPSDVVEGSYIAVSSVDPSGFDGIWEVLSVDGLDVTVIPPYGAVASDPGTYVSGGDVATSALPNPFLSDSLGNYFFYAAPGIYGVQIYDALGRISELDLADQNVVAGGGNGSVTSVALTMPAEFDVSGSPVTSSGTLEIDYADEDANEVFAGPESGSAAAPAFRALVADDIPDLDYVASVGLSVTVPAILTESVSGSPVTGTGTIDLTIGLANEDANYFLAGPTSGGAGQPTFRAIGTSDLPPTSQFPVVTLSGSADALTYPSQSFVTTAGVDAMTLATPTAGTDDGKELTVVSTTAEAHTITTAADKIAPSHDKATFNGTAGSFVTFVAYQGLWYPAASSGVTFSEV